MALMQLVSYGAMDTYLTGNPQVTFFNVQYNNASHGSYSTNYSNSQNYINTQNSPFSTVKYTKSTNFINDSLKYVKSTNFINESIT